MLADVLLDLGLDGMGKHALGAFAHDLVESALADEACFASLVLGICRRVRCAFHGYLLVKPTLGRLAQPIHNFWLYLRLLSACRKRKHC